MTNFDMMEPPERETKAECDEAHREFMRITLDDPDAKAKAIKAFERLRRATERYQAVLLACADQKSERA
jgi:hypothetical protein